MALARLPIARRETVDQPASRNTRSGVPHVAASYGVVDRG